MLHVIRHHELGQIRSALLAAGAELPWPLYMSAGIAEALEAVAAALRRPEPCPEPESVPLDGTEIDLPDVPQACPEQGPALDAAPICPGLAPVAEGIRTRAERTGMNWSRKL